MISSKYTRMDKDEISKISDLCGHTYKICRPYFKKTRTALDIGSKKGHFARHMCKDFDHVHMFDMRPKMQWALVDKNKCFLHKVALGNRSGQIKHTGAVTNILMAGRKQQEAELRTLDSYNFSDVDFIKLDVEGDERDILQGAIDTLKRCKPIVVLEQNHVTEKYNKGRYGDAVRWLEQNNYKIVDYDGMDDWIMSHV